MGTTSRPLIIWVEEKWLDRKEVKALTEKGHTVLPLLFHEPDAPRGDADMPDLIISEKAWRWHDAYWEHIEVALKEARKGQPAKRANVEAERKPRRSKRPKSATAK